MNKRMVCWTLSAVGSVSLLIGACGGDAASRHAVDHGVRQERQAASATFFVAAPDATSHDRQFASSCSRDIVESNALSELATKRAMSADVVAFANQDLIDQQALRTELTKLSSVHGLVLPTELDTNGQTQLSTLTAAQGAAFDLSYINMQVANLQASIQRFGEASQAADDADLRIWAAQVYPKLQRRLQAAVQIQSRLTGA